MSELSSVRPWQDKAMRRETSVIHKGKERSMKRSLERQTQREREKKEKRERERDQKKEKNTKKKQSEGQLVSRIHPPLPKS